MLQKKVGKSKTVINYFLNLSDNYGKRNSKGRPKALPSRGWKNSLTTCFGRKSLKHRNYLTNRFQCFKRKIYATLLDELAIFYNQQSLLNLCKTKMLIQKHFFHDLIMVCLFLLDYSPKLFHDRYYIYFS